MDIDPRFPRRSLLSRAPLRPARLSSGCRAAGYTVQRWYKQWEQVARPRTEWPAPCLDLESAARINAEDRVLSHLNNVPVGPRLTLPGQTTPRLLKLDQGCQHQCEKLLESSEMQSTPATIRPMPTMAAASGICLKCTAPTIVMNAMPRPAQTA